MRSAVELAVGWVVFRAMADSSFAVEADPGTYRPKGGPGRSDCIARSMPMGGPV
jgi:hypothetical protein